MKKFITWLFKETTLKRMIYILTIILLIMVITNSLIITLNHTGGAASKGGRINYADQYIKVGF